MTTLRALVPTAWPGHPDDPEHHVHYGRFRPRERVTWEAHNDQPPVYHREWSGVWWYCTECDYTYLVLDGDQMDELERLLAECHAPDAPTNIRVDDYPLPNGKVYRHTLCPLCGSYCGPDCGCLDVCPAFYCMSCIPGSPAHRLK